MPKRLVHVHLAREFEGVAKPAVRMKHNRVGRHELPGTGAALLDKLEFTEFVVAPVQPDIEPAFAPRVGGEGLRDHQPVWLHGTVEP